jgi:hypothetical protein
MPSVYNSPRNESIVWCLSSFAKLAAVLASQPFPKPNPPTRRPTDAWDQAPVRSYTSANSRSPGATQTHAGWCYQYAWSHVVWGFSERRVLQHRYQPKRSFRRVCISSTFRVQKWRQMRFWYRQWLCPNTVRRAGRQISKYRFGCDNVQWGLASRETPAAVFEPEHFHSSSGTNAGGIRESKTTEKDPRL